MRGFSPEGFSTPRVVSPRRLFPVPRLSEAWVLRKPLDSLQRYVPRYRLPEMADQEGMSVELVDEAYVSGNLSSGGFPSLGGEEKDAPSSSGPSLSLGSETGGERRKMGSKGRDAIGKGLSQLPGRRKNSPSTRRGGTGLIYADGKAPGKSLGSAASSLPTPTTQLSKQINAMGLASPQVAPGGKRTLAERADDMSPMSDTEVRGGPSLSDPGYVSLPHGQSSLELPPSLPREKVGGEGDTRAAADSKQQDSLPPAAGHKSTVTERLQVEHQVRDGSPGVPPVAENVEVVTGPPEQELSRQTEAAGMPSSFKRAASSWERQGAKNPRLTEGPSALLHRPIKVPTIVSPTPMTGRMGSRHKTRRSGVGGLSPERPGPSRSPLSSLEESDTHSAVVSPSHQPAATGGGGGGGGGGPVNFRSIEELSRSDRNPESMEVEQQRNPHMAKVMSLIRTSRESANFSSRHSPQSVRGVSPSPSPINSLHSGRSVSPHSPRSPHTSLTQPSSSGSGSSGAGGETAEGRRQRVAGTRGEGAGGEEEAEAKRQSALLQVSEAHLAILPDEDGDTPLHLSIIHENVRLTQHLVKLIVGVYMNLDIANNMRQTPLHLAIITRQPHIVQMLVQAGASVNFPDRKGNTALHLAAARRDMQVLQILARATSPVPDFNCKNFAGLAPVHLATRESSIDVLKFLFQMGANKNAMDACSGRTSLHYAVEAENFILVNFLLESGCNVNSATFSGNTPLHIAAGRRLKEIVALLMAYGANPALANGEGDFPTDLPASLLMQRARMNAH